MTEEQAKKLMAEGKISNYSVDDKTKKVTIKATMGPNVGDGSWGTGSK